MCITSVAIKLTVLTIKIINVTQKLNIFYEYF